MYKFKFADIGEGLHEGKVAEIYKQKGDKVTEGDSLFSVETDKVTSDIPSPVSGTISNVLIKEGQTIHVGEEVFVIDDGSKTTEEPVQKTEENQESASVVGEVKVSNDLLSFENLFGKNNNSKTSSNATCDSKMTSSQKVTNSNGFDIDSIVPKGDGEKVDIVVIGAGPGGYTAGEFLAKAGYKTVVIEREFAGGVCLNVGCIPTKTLLRSAKILEYVKEAKKYGVDLKTDSVVLNWIKVQERKERVRKQLRSGVETLLKAAKAEFIIGDAKVIDQYNVEVNKRKFTTKVIILASGSENIKLPLKGFDKAWEKGIMIDSTGAIDLEKIPESLTVIGGGVIGLELAFLYKELGSKVTVLEGTPNVLGPMDNEVKTYAKNMVKNKGIDLKLNAMVKSFDEKEGLIYELNGEKHAIKSDKILMSVGRKPQTLNLENTLNLALTERKAIKVNDILQTSIPNIFAIGDVVGQAMLAHVAYKHAHVVVNVIKKQRFDFDLNKVPACVYTHPEISSIGLTEEQLKKEKNDYLKVIWQNQHVGRMLSDNEDTSGWMKLLVDKKYGKILGAHIINPHSSDMISEVAAVMELEGTVYELASSIHPHPSISEVIYEAAVHAVEQLNNLKR